jgi:hypothetical protein
MTNARSIINQAARKISVLGRGQVMPAEEVADALEALNGLLGQFTAETGVLYEDARETFALNGSESYSIGSGGDFDTTKPAVIDAAFVRIGSLDYPLRQIGSGDYAAIGIKSISGIPDSFYYETGEPLGRLFIYPVGVAGYTLQLWSKKALTSFANLTTDYTLPPGFQDMLVYNLAIRLAPEYEKEPSPFLNKMARDTYNAVMGYAKRQDYGTLTIDIADDKADDGNILGGWLTR